ncbi:MAG: hypothetical protein KC646_17325 [Candidatus Cloacimonetes bacterium]|nr:hypothetical protein [Candidatus Cloacimonadota bacterium]
MNALIKTFLEEDCYGEFRSELLEEIDSFRKSKVRKMAEYGLNTSNLIINFDTSTVTIEDAIAIHDIDSIELSLDTFHKLLISSPPNEPQNEQNP